MAKNAVPMAKNAGLAARQSAGNATAWATPHVYTARSWAAPYVEQAGLTVRDKIGPAISDVLVEAAHRIDVPQAAQRRRWAGLVAGFAMLAAAGSAAAAVILRRKPESSVLAPESQPAGEVTTATTGTTALLGQDTGDVTEETTVDGQMPTS